MPVGIEPPRPPIPLVDAELDQDELRQRQAAAMTPQAVASRKAKSLLAGTDFVVIKAAEGRELSREWLGWRESLRKIARGEALQIPAEPKRWTVDAQ